MSRGLIHHRKNPWLPYLGQVPPEKPLVCYPVAGKVGLLSFGSGHLSSILNLCGWNALRKGARCVLSSHRSLPSNCCRISEGLHHFTHANLKLLSLTSISSAGPWAWSPVGIPKLCFFNSDRKGAHCQRASLGGVVTQRSPAKAFSDVPEVPGLTVEVRIDEFRSSWTRFN